MAVSLSVIAAKDSAGSAIAGGLQAQDKSGSGTGPFTLGQILIDGVAGTNMAQVTAANAVKVDGSAVTQPVSGTVTAAQATAASLNATVVGTGTFAVQAAATLAAETTKVIGTVNLSAAQTLATVTNLSQLGGAAISMGTGVRGAGVQRVTISTDDVVPASQSGTWTVQPGNTANTTPWLAKIHDGTTAALVKAASSGAAATTDPALVVTLRDVNGNGRAVPGSSAPVVLNSMTYKAVAASATATLFGATGASGDYLDGVLIVPATAAAGVVSITDGGGSAITIFAGGGTTALPTLAPFYVPIGSISSGGAGGWKVTTGTNVSVIGVGNFT